MNPNAPMTTEKATAVSERVSAAVFFASFFGLLLFVLVVVVLLNDVSGFAFIAIVWLGPIVAMAFVFSAVSWAISRPLAKWALPLLVIRYEQTNAARILCVFLSVGLATIGVIALLLSDPTNFAKMASIFVLGAWPLITCVVAVLFALLLLRQMRQEIRA